MNLPEWLTDVDKFVGRKVYCILVGNKSDRARRAVTTNLGMQFAAQNNMPFLETSAKNSSNINQLFLQLARTLRDLYAENMKKMEGTSAKVDTVSLMEPTKEQGCRKCCY